MRCETDLRWYLLIGAGEMQQSLQGHLLEKAEIAWFSSELRKDGSNARLPQVNKNDWNYMHLKPTMSGDDDPGYLPSEEGMMRCSEVETMLRAIDERSRRVLCALWGPVGESWAWVEERGRDFAVYPLTDYGSKWVLELRAAGMEGTADVVISLQADKGDDLRRLKFKKMRQEADDLIAEANKAWQAARVRLSI